METSNWLIIISLIIGLLQGLILIMIGTFKKEVKDLWERANRHGHKIECSEDSCKARTTAVLIHEG